VFSLFAFSSFLRSPQSANSLPGGPFVVYGELLVNALILVGVVVGVGVLFNIRNLAFRLPGFSSPIPRTRTMTWVGYGAVMVLLAVMLDVVLPGAAGSAARNAPEDSYLHVKVTTADDGSEAYVMVGGDLTVDLASWPASEWSGVTFKTSNPSILSLAQAPPAGSDPIAVFTARQEGTSRVDAASADGRYTFQLRVVTASG
jgi:hypothetical protein